MTTLTLEASKRVFELIGQYETAQNHLIQEETDCLCGEHGDRGYELIPAPNFADLIRVLPRLEKERKRTAQSLSWIEMTFLYINAPTEPEGMKTVEDYLMKIL